MATTLLDAAALRRRGFRIPLLPLLLLALHATPAAALRCVPAALGAALPAVHLPRAAARSGTAQPLMAAEQRSSVSKQALVDAIALKAGVPKKTAALLLGATLDVIVDSVCDGSRVSLVGFGTFASKERPERMARNPKTGEQFMVAAATVPSFSFGKSFKEAVKEAGKAGAADASPPTDAPATN